jgi:hypothetical protein
MAIETIFEVAGFVAPRDVLYFRMLVRYNPQCWERFEFVFEMRRSENISHEFLAIAEFSGQTPNVQFHLPSKDPVSIGLLSCIARAAIGPILACYDKDPERYLDGLKTKGLREIGTPTIAHLLDCLSNLGHV